MVRSSVAIGNQAFFALFFHLFHQQGLLFVDGRPRIGMCHIHLQKRGDGGGHQWVVGAIHNAFAIVEYLGFFARFFVHRSKAFIVLAADVGNHAYGRANHGLQIVHFSGGGDAGFNNGKRGVVVDVPQRERHTDLRIVAPRRAHDFVVVGEQMIEPLFHSGFASTAGDSNHGNVEASAMIGGEGLERFESVGHHQKVGFTHFARHIVDVVHHKGAHASLIERSNIVVTVVVGGFQCKKYGFFRVGERTRIGEQLAHGGVFVANAMVVNTQNVGYFYDRVFHCSEIKSLISLILEM